MPGKLSRVTNAPQVFLPNKADTPRHIHAAPAQFAVPHHPDHAGRQFPQQAGFAIGCGVHFRQFLARHIGGALARQKAHHDPAARAIGVFNQPPAFNRAHHLDRQVLAPENPAYLVIFARTDPHVDFIGPQTCPVGHLAIIGGVRRQSCQGNQQAKCGSNRTGERGEGKTQHGASITTSRAVLQGCLTAPAPNPTLVPVSPSNSGLCMTVVTDTPNTPHLNGKPRIIVTRRLLPPVEARMAELFDAQFNHSDTPMDRAALVAAMQAADVLVPCVTDRIDEAMLAQACDDPATRRLGLIASFGAGTDHIDLAAARARKIPVTNTPGVFTDDTADLTMALILGACRQFYPAAKALRNQGWHGWAPTGFLGHRLGGKRLAIIGMGRIGQAVAHRARGFGLEVVYHNRHRLPAAHENMLSARYEADLDKLIAEADILSLHCPSSPSVHHLLNAARLATMKPTAYVINTARGDLIDEDALLTALETGQISGAGLDVYHNEPSVNPRFLALDNAVLLPHLGSATFEGREAAGERIIANIRFWADGHRPPDQVLPELEARR